MRVTEVMLAGMAKVEKGVRHWVAAHFKGGPETAIRTVNREESDPSACGVVNAAFVRGPNVAAVSQGNMAFQIVRILVLGVAGPEGFRAVQPAPYFTVFGVTEYPV